jgi:hypothetical protein
MDTKPPVDLSFINRDVQIQLAQSKELLSIVQSLETTLSTMPQGEARSIVEQTAKRLLGVASILASNANSTSNTAALTVVSSSAAR